MKIVHLMAGLQGWSGVANIARRFARVQRDRGDEAVLLAPAFKWNPIYFGLVFAVRAWRAAKRADEIWVHCSWTFPVWYGAFLARRFGKKLIVVPEGSFDPARLHNQAGWKKRLVAPLDRWVLRAANEVLALCAPEVDWVKSFEPVANVREEKVPLFLKDGGERRQPQPFSSTSALHVLFLGRVADPLKGIRYLKQAVKEIQSRTKIELRLVSNHFGAELEEDWAWCDVLCLPTLSENFGLVVAEALERGKRVITTDGAPAWDGQPGVVYLKGYREGTDPHRVDLLKNALSRMIGHED